MIEGGKREGMGRMDEEEEKLCIFLDINNV